MDQKFLKSLGIKFPLVGAPMFLVSNVDVVSAVSNAGALGTFPSLNFRPPSEFRKALKDIRARTKNPFGVNIIVNKSNPRLEEDLKIALDDGVPVFITSLGNPERVIKDAHANGAKVFCDVISLHHAKKAQDLGADGVIAVCHGAGGHAGPISPLVFIPLLRKELSIPVIASGGIAHGSAIAAVLALGASAAYVGTRFIASKEAPVHQAYKDAIVNAKAEDIVMTDVISGTPAAVINTPFVQSQGLRLNPILRFLHEHPRTKRLTTAFLHLRGAKQLESSIEKATWKNVWSAGQSVGLIDSVESCEKIVETLIQQMTEAMASLSGTSQPHR